MILVINSEVFSDTVPYGELVVVFSIMQSVVLVNESTFLLICVTMWIENYEDFFK